MRLTTPLIGIVAILYFTESALAIDLGALGMTAITNIFRTPQCAMKCIFDPHWMDTYAPECAGLPVGKELGQRLCQNVIYQHMIDDCIKGNCNDDERGRVCP
jgi:hypothetical protein